MPTVLVSSVQPASSPTAQLTPLDHRSRFLDAFAILLGAMTTLAVHGYRFGDGNHTIYLLDALRKTDPELLRYDWFATQTLQYHAIFGWFAATLMRLGIVEVAFAICYVALACCFHVGWFRIVRQLSGTRSAYLASVVLYYLSAAGTGLGAYQFLQDSSLLPSNIANVAMLWAFHFWIARRRVASGACFGLAACFHLNHAVVGTLIWLLLCLTILHDRRAILTGSLLALIPAVLNISLALGATMHRSGSIPLAEFVNIYVRLRHPHHYDPASWSIGIWLAFAWSLPFAAMLKPPARTIVAILASLQIIALIGAGVWFVNESLVQMSLYRFSIYIQLFGCISAAMILSSRIAVWLAPIGCAAIVAFCLIRGPFFGVFKMPADDREYLLLCDWARRHTPRDAVFLVPPGESSFRLRAQRAIVVNYKGVPQLSGELHEWIDRMNRVLAIDDLRELPHGYAKTLAAIDSRFDSLAEDQLVAVATSYGARFIVTRREMPDLTCAFSSPENRYFLYDRESQRESDKK